VISLGGGIGALLRHAATSLGTPDSRQVRRRITAINVGGAFFAGVLVTIDHPLALAIVIGLAGSLTTLSTIAVWIAEDFRHREHLHAVKVLLGHILLGVPAVLAGFLAGQILL
jgi:fluoride ion exporter CrcB/FEX